MLLPRELYSSPPAARTALQNNPTILVSWWCTGFALAIIIVRLLGRLVRTERLFTEDKVMALAIIPLCARMGLVHVVLLWGTNNAITDGLSPEDIYHREIGSRLVLASRITYALFLWVAKFTVCEFLKRLTEQVERKSYEIGLRCIRWFLFVTFIAVVIATLAECQPFPHYWQVVPDPGAMCRQGMTQLITMASCDVITDIVLVCFPIPIVLKSHMPLKRKISLILLFGLSLILVGITIYRVVGVTQRHADQQFRSLVASLEILAAAAVSNAIVLGSFVRDRGEKKRRFRFGSNAGASSLDRPPTTPKKTLTNMEWGSDTDLVSSLGMRCSPSLTERRQSDMLARPAPMALPTAEQANRLTPAPAGISSKDWSFQRPRQGSADNIDLDLEERGEPINNPHPEVPTTPRGGMSFFDVGGLLIHNDPSRSPRSPGWTTDPPSSSSSPPRQQQPPQSPRNFSYPSPMSSPRTTFHQSPAFTSPGTSRQGSHTLLQDIGGLLQIDSHHPQQRPYSDSPSLSPSASNPSSPQPEQHHHHERENTRNRNRNLTLADVLREEEEEEEGEGERPAPNGHLQSSAVPQQQPRYAPVQHGRRAQRDLQDVGGLLG